MWNFVYEQKPDFHLFNRQIIPEVIQEIKIRYCEEINIWKFGFCSYTKFHIATEGSIISAGKYSGGYHCGWIKSMHIEFVSKKKIFVALSGSNILPPKVCPRGDFFGKIFGTFWKSGRPWQVYSGRTYPNPRGINIYIERASHNNIGRLGVSKNFWRKKGIFFGPRFFSLFHPKFSCGRTSIFFQKQKWKFGWKNSMFFSVWSTLMPVSFTIVLWVAHESFQKSVKSKMLRNNFWSPRKKIK